MGVVCANDPVNSWDALGLVDAVGGGGTGVIPDQVIAITSKVPPGWQIKPGGPHGIPSWSVENYQILAEALGLEGFKRLPIKSQLYIGKLLVDILRYGAQGHDTSVQWSHVRSMPSLMISDEDVISFSLAMGSFGMAVKVAGGAGLVGRRGAFNQAKRDAGIPRSQKPTSIRKVPMTSRSGKVILGKNGKPIMTREYTFTKLGGKKVVIQDHSAGHQYPGGVGNQGSHFNVRPPENTRTGKVAGTEPHYDFRK